MLTLPVPGLSLEQQPPEILLPICLWGEARGEGPLGMLGVAHVIVNRAYGPKASLPEAMTADSGHALKVQILKPLQFSCFNKDDPNRVKLLEPHKHEPLPWGQALAVAILVLNGMTLDPTHGAKNYLTADLYESDSAPKWAKQMAITARHGNHVFGVALLV